MSNIKGLYQVITNVNLRTIHNVYIPGALRVFNVPKELLKTRARFVSIPEVLPELLKLHYKPSLISTIDITLPPKNPWR